MASTPPQNATSKDHSRAAFFDRDGVLIVDTGYLSEPKDILWVDGVQRAPARLAARSDRLFVVTNQSGVARRYFGEAAVGLPPHRRADRTA